MNAPEPHEALVLGVMADHDRMLADLITERDRNKQLRDYIGRHGFGHTDWPNDPIGCDGPGPGCPGRCIARCENVDNLNARIYAARAALAAAEARVVALEQVGRSIVMDADALILARGSVDGKALWHSLDEMRRALLHPAPKTQDTAG